MAERMLAVMGMVGAEMDELPDKRHLRGLMGSVRAVMARLDEEDGGHSYFFNDLNGDFGDDDLTALGL